MAENSDTKTAAARQLIGRAIIDGLVTGVEGRFRLLQNYEQGTGGYWQTDGGSHIQSGGDYHQT